MKKHTVIIGVGPGLGYSLAHKFGSEGHRVTLIARRQEALDQFVEQLQDEQIEADGFAADVTKEADMKHVFATIKEKVGPVDTLIYNAARVEAHYAVDTTATLTEEHLQVNLLGGIRAAEQVFPEMIEHGEGSILFTGGGRSELTALSMVTPLSISKSGLRSYVHCLHDELIQKGIFVGMLSVHGVIREDTYYSPDNIASTYFDFYQKQDRVETFYVKDEDA